MLQLSQKFIAKDYGSSGTETFSLMRKFRMQKCGEMRREGLFSTGGLVAGQNPGVPFSESTSAVLLRPMKGCGRSITSVLFSKCSSSSHSSRC
jgi:hypothetical protein